MILELANLSNVGRQFHHMGDLSGGIAQRRGPDQDVVLLTGFGGNDHFGLVGLPVFKCSGNWTVGAGFISVFVNFMTESTEFNVKIFFKTSIGCRQSELSILNRYITGHFIKKLLVALLGAVQFCPQALDFGNIDRYLHHQFHIAVPIANRCGVYDHRCFIALDSFNGCFCTQAFAGFKCLFSGAFEFGAGFIRINIPAVVADFIAQPLFI